MRLAIVLFSLALAAADLRVSREGDRFLAHGLSAEEPAAGWASVFQVFVGDGEALPPVLGTYSKDGDAVVFRPRFEIPASVACRVVAGGKTFPFAARMTAVEPTAFVSKVYPTARKIPANQLKFYVEFSAPMEKGQAWERIRLKDRQGQVVDLAFLEIEQELWDREGKRLTLLFDPGRIKRGVMPRDQVGAALRAGETYTLVIDQEYREAEGVPLARGFFKVFEVEDEDRTAVDPMRWEVRVPRAGTRDSLVVLFGESLDAPLAQRMIRVEGMEGTVDLGGFETIWRFAPAAPWKSGDYKIVVDTALEDMAGNRVGRPFDVDVFERITVRTGRGTVTIPFHVPSGR